MTDTRYEALFEKITEEAEKKLSAHFPWLAFPFLGMEKVFSKKVSSISTDGKTVRINPDFIIETAAENGVSGVETAFVQATLSNLLLFTFRYDGSEEYSFSADAILFYLTDKMNLPYKDRRATESRKALYKSINDDFGGVTREYAEAYLKMNDAISKREDFALLEWGKRKKEETGKSDTDHAEEEWIALAAEILPRIGNEYADLRREVANVAESGRDWKKLLTKFLKKTERLRSNDEEFDYILYTYGLSLYGNVPLVENLEYREENELSDLIVAIDTSGSTEGEPVAKFLSEIYGIMKQAERRSEKTRLRIIQADDRVQREEIAESSEDFENLLKNFGLVGGGGTDFRPVFARANQLVKEGVKVKGLVYFTDGVGIYPKETPPYKTCFAIYGNGAEAATPHYALRIDVAE